MEPFSAGCARDTLIQGGGAVGVDTKIPTAITAIVMDNHVLLQVEDQGSSATRIFHIHKYVECTPSSFYMTSG